MKEETGKLPVKGVLCPESCSVLTTSSTFEQSCKQQVQGVTVFRAGVGSGLCGAEEGEAERQQGKKEIRHRHRHRRGGAALRHRWPPLPL